MDTSLLIPVKSSLEKIYDLIESNSLPEAKEIANFLSEWFNNDPNIQQKTSGSTGTPKLIELNKESMKKSAELTQNFFQLEANQTALLCLPIQYIAGKMMVVRALETEMNLLVIPNSASPTQFLSSDKVIDFAAMTPMQVMNGFNADHIHQLKKIKALIIGGGKVNTILKKLIVEHEINAYETYGMTETITHIAVKKLNTYNLLEPFKGLKGIKLGQTPEGTLTIRAKHLGDEIITTEDVVEFVDFNQFYWLGRANNTINSGGVKIQPEEIEKKIAGLFESNFFISSKEDEVLGEKIILIIEGKPFSTPTLNLLKQHLSEILPKIEVPKGIFFLEQFNYTETKKIRRKATTQIIQS